MGDISSRHWDQRPGGTEFIQSEAICPRQNLYPHPLYPSICHVNPQHTTAGGVYFPALDVTHVICPDYWNITECNVHRDWEVLPVLLQPLVQLGLLWTVCTRSCSSASLGPQARHMGKPSIWLKSRTKQRAVVLDWQSKPEPPQWIHRQVSKNPTAHLGSSWVSGAGISRPGGLGGEPHHSWPHQAAHLSRLLNSN